MYLKFAWSKQHKKPFVFHYYTKYENWCVHSLIYDASRWNFDRCFFQTIQNNFPISSHSSKQLSTGYLLLGVKLERSKLENDDGLEHTICFNKSSNFIALFSSYVNFTIGEFKLLSELLLLSIIQFFLGWISKLSYFPKVYISFF